MLLIVLVVLFTMSMFLWLLTLLGAIPDSNKYTNWLAWFAVMVLGMALFLGGFGVASWRP